MKVFSGSSSHISGNVSLNTGKIVIPIPTDQSNNNQNNPMKSGNIEIKTGNCEIDRNSALPPETQRNLHCHAGAIKLQGGEGNGKHIDGNGGGGGGDVILKGGYGNMNADGGIVEIQAGISANGKGGALSLTSGSNLEKCQSNTADDTGNIV